jgi:deoxycytidine triphosphate deaminase
VANLREMYLTDHQIKDRLNEFELQAEHADLPFDASRQIGPCSIDLRLSLVYWTPRRKNRLGRHPVIDLERSQLRELSPARGWRRHELRPGEKITLRPGEMILARVSERFRIPSDCAGAIEGRSSFARLGLSIHSTGGFINPGWRGHMPLTLINNSPSNLRIPVGIPICQLMVVKLDGSPHADYAARSDRKYLNDSGGPSYWWRDVHLKEIRDALGGGTIESRVFDELDELLVETEDEAFLERLENYIADQRGRSYGSADELLEGFSSGERRRERARKVAVFAGTWSWTVFVTIAVTVWATTTAPTWGRVLATVLVLLSGLAVIWAVGAEDKSYLTPTRLTSLRKARDRRREDRAPREPRE